MVEGSRDLSVNYVNTLNLILKIKKQKHSTVCLSTTNIDRDIGKSSST